MVVTFVLVIPDKDEFVDTADCPEDLDLDKAYPYTLWEVHARHEEIAGAGGPMTCIARVNLEGTADYDDNFTWACNEVHAELKLRHVYGEFDDPKYMSDGPVVDIGYECPDCASGGCRDCNRGCEE